MKEGGEAWKPAEEPRTGKEAGTLRSESEGRLTEAEQRVRDAEERGEEPTREEELNVARAKYDLSTAEIAEAKITLADPKADPSLREQAGKDLGQAQLDKQAIDTRLQALSKEVGTAYEPATPTVDPLKWENYYSGIEKSVSRAPEEEKLRVLNKEFLSAKKTYENYAEQREALVQLHDLVPDQKGERADKFRQQLQDRIGEIDAYLKNPPPRLAQNEIAVRLKLSEKISSDQVFSVKREFAVNKDIKDNIKDLEQLLGAMRRYGIDAKEPGFTQTVKDRIKSLEPKKEPPVSQEVKDMEEQEGMFSKAMSSAGELAKSILPEGVVEGAGVAADVVAKFVKFTAEDIGSGVKNVIENTPNVLSETLQNVRLAGEKLTEQSIDAQEWAETVAWVPEIAQVPVEIFGKVTEAIGSLEPAVRWIPGERAASIADSLARQKRIGKDAQENYAAFSKTTERLAPFINAIGKQGERIGKWLTDHIEKTSPFLSDVERAGLFVDQERYNILDESRVGKFKKMMDSVVDFGKKLGSWFKEKVFKVSERKLATATKNYDTARTDYLTTIGFTAEEIAKKPTVAEIKSKLGTALANEETRNQLQGVNDTLAQHTNELAQVYNDLAKNLDSARANYEFLTKGWWDRLYIADKRTATDMVNAVIDSRDMATAYLQATREGLNQLTEDINSVAQGTAFQDITDKFLDTVSTMINGQMIETIGEYEKSIGDIDSRLEKEKKALEAFIAERTLKEGPPG